MELLPVRSRLHILRTAKSRTTIFLALVVALFSDAPHINQEPRIKEDGIILVNRRAKTLFLVRNTRIKVNRHRNIAGGNESRRNFLRLRVLVRGGSGGLLRVKLRVITQPNTLNLIRSIPSVPNRAFHFAERKGISAAIFEVNRETIPLDTRWMRTSFVRLGVREGESVHRVNALIEKRLSCRRINAAGEIHPLIFRRVILNPNLVSARLLHVYRKVERIIHHLNGRIIRRGRKLQFLLPRIAGFRDRLQINALCINSP